MSRGQSRTSSRFQPTNFSTSELNALPSKGSNYISNMSQNVTLDEFGDPIIDEEDMAVEENEDMYDEVPYSVSRASQSPRNSKFSQRSYRSQASRSVYDEEDADSADDDAMYGRSKPSMRSVKSNRSRNLSRSQASVKSKRSRMYSPDSSTSDTSLECFDKRGKYKGICCYPCLDQPFSLCVPLPCDPLSIIPGCGGSRSLDGCCQRSCCQKPCCQKPCCQKSCCSACGPPKCCCKPKQKLKFYSGLCFILISEK